MHLSSPKAPFTLHALLIAAGLLASLSLGACSRSSHVTDSLAGPTREGSSDLAAGGIGRLRHQPPATPALSTPTDGAIDVALNPTLAWNAVIGAKTYRLQVSTSSAFAATVVDQAGISATSAGVSGLLASTRYFWRVSARNPGGSSAFSVPFSFTTAAAAPPPPPPPAAPTLSTPTDGALGVALNPTLTWNAAAGADSYRLQVSTSAAFAVTLVDQSGILLTSAGISGLSAGTQYFWRVSASNAGGSSAFSAPFSFTTAPAAPPPPPPAPAAPTLSAPTNGAIDVALNPALSWNASAGADSYRLQVSTSAAFAVTLVDQSGILLTSAGISGLSASTQYFWRVSASNAGGSSAFSAPFSFTTLPPPVSIDPCASLNGLGGPVVSVLADIPQFRINRLRIEIVGDVTAGTINALGACVPGAAPTVQFISGTGSVTLSGSGTPVTTSGGSIAFGPLLAPVPAEPGVVLIIDAAGNVLEIIWPGLAGLPPGPPILRLQLGSYSAAVQTGVSLDATMTFTARAPDGSIATFTAIGRNMVVPPLR